MLRWLVRLQLAPQIPGRRPLLFPNGRSRAVLRSLLVIGGSRLGHSSSSAPSRSSFRSSPAAAPKVEPAPDQHPRGMHRVTFVGWHIGAIVTRAPSLTRLSGCR